jgi:hypothetical protein
LFGKVSFWAYDDEGDYQRIAEYNSLHEAQNDIASGVTVQSFIKDHPGYVRVMTVSQQSTPKFPKGKCIRWTPRFAEYRLVNVTQKTLEWAVQDNIEEYQHAMDMLQRDADLSGYMRPCELCGGDGTVQGLFDKYLRTCPYCKGTGIHHELDEETQELPALNESLLFEAVTEPKPAVPHISDLIDQKVWSA